MFGELFHEHWENKKKRSSGVSDPKIDEAYEVARKNGALGGKLIGAGGGGFLKTRRAEFHALARG